MENYELKKCKSLGKLLGFFFTILGLFAGFLYPQDSEERKNFIDGWKAGFEILLYVAVISLVVILIFSAAAL